MKIIIIGAAGNIGGIITPLLAQKHEVITAGRSGGDLRVDLSSKESIEAMFMKQGQVDGCICVAGDSYGGELFKMSQDDLAQGIGHKLVGQVNLVLTGEQYLKDGGFFTLISGKMGDRPALHSAGKAMVNGGINSFVRAAALEMPRGIRINAVSPAKVADIPEGDLLNAYLKCIHSQINGQILTVNYN